jgi:hypothetical protein
MASDHAAQSAEARTADPHPPPGSRGPAALVVAHPGHELALHGWLEARHPRVFVLTDGSGNSGQSRLGSTRTLLERAGAFPGEIFGACPDRRLYGALLAGETSFFLGFAERLAAAIVRGGIAMVVADSAEGYNPAHDVCRLVADAAVRAAMERGRAVTNWDFPLTRPAAENPRGTLRLVLDGAALARKRAAADAYPEMRSEVEAALARSGPEEFRVETLRPVDPEAEFFSFGGAAPQYEAFGERRVTAGRYERVIRFREHVRPVAEALGAVLSAAG